MVIVTITEKATAATAAAAAAAVVVVVVVVVVMVAVVGLVAGDERRWKWSYLRETMTYFMPYLCRILLLCTYICR